MEPAIQIREALRDDQGVLRVEVADFGVGA
jgi:hypothetical protein